MTDKFMAQLAEIHASGRCRGGINDPWGMRSHTPECRALVDADAAARRETAAAWELVNAGTAASVRQARRILWLRRLRED